jgi:WS/DGAT/MGAT family acyltransferase
VEDDNIDLEYHVRHAALPWPGGERELGELVGRLQSTPLDLSRPPWECTIVEGIDGNRFGMFIKMHHSLIDGISGVKLLQNSMSSDRSKSLQLPPFWASGKAPQPKARKRADALVPTVTSAIAGAVQELRMQAATLPQLVGAFGKMVQQALAPGVAMALPFAAPRSVLNGRVREKRRFATQQFSLARMKAVATAAECTLNDVVLAMCGGALRRFLDERDNLPDKPLTAGIPVSVRPKDDDRNGNAITFIVSTLGTDIAGVRERLSAIRQSVKLAKEHVQSLPRQAMMQYTVMLMAPTILTLLTGIGGRIRPMFNITISNVPGPETPLYFRGAEMVASYPASIVTHGQALNITCQSYAGFMNFGFTGCHSSVPSMQRLAVYTADALAEMEAAFLPATPVAKALAAPKVVRMVKPKAAQASATAPARAPRKKTA